MVGPTERDVDARLERVEREIAKLTRRTWLLGGGLGLAIGALLAPGLRDVIVAGLVASVAVLGVVGFIRLVMAGLERRDRRSTSSDESAEDL